MKIPRLLIIGGLAMALPAWAVYAPVPEQDQGKDLTFTFKGGFTFDTNIFGSASNETESGIWEFAPTIAYNHSLNQSTFLMASYGLTLDYYTNRPGDDLLDSHAFNLRLAHQFAKETTIDVTDVFAIVRNPESLLPGVTTPLNSDQSYDRNELDGRFDHQLNGKIGLSVKARSIYYQYHNDSLGDELDRTENLFGISGNYAILPELKLVGEYRHQNVYYRHLGDQKDKRSDYAMGGLDYNIARKLSLTGRVGWEWRNRVNERDTDVPYVEASLKYDYAQDSFLASGYTYTLEEPSDTNRYTDSQVHRLFINVQHHVTALIVASGSLIYEPAKLQGRRSVPPSGLPQPNLDEDTVRAGFGLSYQPTKNWSLSATADFDNTDSDDPNRNLRRQRYGVSASYSF